MSSEQQGLYLACVYILNAKGKIHFSSLESVFTYPDENARRPPVPKHTEKPVMGLKSNKNFITNNAVENIMSVPKKPAAKFVDTKDGKTNNLEPSGLVPKYLKKKDYGKTPAYLVQRKEDMEQAQRDYDEYIKENMKRGAMNCLSNEERLVNLYL